MKTIVTSYLFSILQQSLFLLPTTYVVREKVTFSIVSVLLPGTGEEAADQLSRSPPPPRPQSSR